MSDQGEQTPEREDTTPRWRGSVMRCPVSPNASVALYWDGAVTLEAVARFKEILDFCFQDVVTPADSEASKAVECLHCGDSACSCGCSGCMAIRSALRSAEARGRVQGLREAADETLKWSTSAADFIRELAHAIEQETK